MDQSEDRKEGARKGTLPVEEEGRNKTLRWKNKLGPRSDPSWASFRSYKSMEVLPNFKGISPIMEQMDQESSETSGGLSIQTELDSIFLLLEDNIVTFVKKELKKIKKLLSQREDEEEMESEYQTQRSSRESLMKITENFLRRMKQEELADRLQSSFNTAVCRHKVQSGLKKKFQCVFDGSAKAGNPTLLYEIYTELYVTEQGTRELNEEHEVRQIETASRKADRAETSIRQEELLKLPAGRQEPIRTVMTKGVAGIGKTVLTQKFTLDWAEGKANQNIHFTFPFTFRELNELKEKFSLVELVHHFFPETKEAGIHSFEDFQVLFIFDGLDECRLPLDFHKTWILNDPRKSTSVGDLLTNLIRGNLLLSARLWITTRPAAANQIPAECVDMVTEVRGFNDPQKGEYFRKRFRDEEQASRIISHIKRSQSLHIMCRIPVFCWITATVLEDLLKSREGGELPKSLTEMYIHFLVVQAKVKKVKYDGGAETDPHWSPESRKMMESLGKLAFKQLQKGNLIFYESDLIECGIDIRAASVYSGVLTQIFREERGLYQDKVFCFIHLSVQEFLAALHVHLTFINSGLNLMEEEQSNISKPELSSPVQFYQSAVIAALQSPNGHLDLFLRFLLGLSLQTNQSLLHGLLTQTESSSQTNQDTVQFIKEKISEDLSAEKSINLFHCLNELIEGSLVEEIQQFLKSGRHATHKLSPAQWSALVFILLSSEEDLEEFDLKKYSGSEEALLRLLPVIKASCKAVLSRCNLSERSYPPLSTVLSSPSSKLRDLDLSFNKMQDSGVEILSIGLESPKCKLESLRLVNCSLTEKSCKALGTALKNNPSTLTKLDMSVNNLQDSGFLHLRGFLESPHCRLQTLRFELCSLSGISCETLVSALKSNPSNLTELDLSWNKLQGAGFLYLCSFLKRQHCRLQTLRLMHCSLTKFSCEALVSSLKFNPCNLTELDLSENDLQDSGVLHLCGFLESPDCRLQTLRLELCRLSKITCAALVSALKSNPSHLTELDLKNNDLHPSDVQQLQDLVESPNCKLQTLRVESPRLSEKKEKISQSQTSSFFTPVVNLDRNGVSYRFKFSGSGLFQCSLTGLMFDITHSGEVEYRTFIWDPDLLESLHLEARGPLFSIKSPQGSVSQLQLPHCEPEPLSDSLSVLHITDYGTSRLQPVMVTESHVVVNVPHLSLFGIVINLIRNLTTKTNGQVLLFQDSTNNFFSIHVVMLPSNVPLYQVKEFHSDSKFIKVPSHCIFYKDQTYSCHSDPGDFKIQPSKAEVSANYGPNYHPLFSMRLPLRTEEVTIFIKDQEDQVMWMYTLHQSEMTEHEQKDRSFSTEKFKQIGPGFVERVSEATLDSLLFTLHQCGAITSEEEEYIRAANQRSKKARQLFDIVTKKGLSSLLMKNLKDEDTFLYQELCLM